MTSNPCLEYTDVYGRKTDLIHIARGATYPINILGNAATADVANNPIEDLLPDSADTISFRSGDELDDKSNEFTHKITMVNEAAKATNDGNDENIAETYARKEDVVTLDPETGKVRTDQLPDTTNNVNYVNGKTGDVELYGSDIQVSSSDTKKIDEYLKLLNAVYSEAIASLKALKQDKAAGPFSGYELENETAVYDTHKTVVLSSVSEGYTKEFTDTSGTEEWSDTSFEWTSGQLSEEVWYDPLSGIAYADKGFGKFREILDVAGSKTAPLMFKLSSQITEFDSYDNLVQLWTARYSVSADTASTFNAYKYSLRSGFGELFLDKTDKDGQIVETSTAAMNAIGIFNFAPASLFDVSVNLRVDINWDNIANNYNMGYLEMLDKTTGTWTIRNMSRTRIAVMRFGGRFNSGARISPLPDFSFIDANSSVTFYLDSDDPYLDRNSFGLLVWKLGTEA